MWRIVSWTWCMKGFCGRRLGEDMTRPIIPHTIICTSNPTLLQVSFTTVYRTSNSRWDTVVQSRRSTVGYLNNRNMERSCVFQGGNASCNDVTRVSKNAIK